jgi:hypothetical protein
VCAWYGENYASRAAAGAYLKVPISCQLKPGVAGRKEGEVMLKMEAEPGIEPRSTALQNDFNNPPQQPTTINNYGTNDLHIWQ